MVVVVVGVVVGVGVALVYHRHNPNIYFAVELWFVRLKLNWKGENEHLREREIVTGRSRML